jgi:hypothetical protein
MELRRVPTDQDLGTIGRRSPIVGSQAIEIAEGMGHGLQPDDRRDRSAPASTVARFGQGEGRLGELGPPTEESRPRQPILAGVRIGGLKIGWSAFVHTRIVRAHRTAGALRGCAKEKSKNLASAV